MAELFNIDDGIGGILQWITIETNGLFFSMVLFILFLVLFIPMLNKWDGSQALFGAMIGVFCVSLPLYALNLIPDVTGLIVLLGLISSIVKITIFD